MIVGRILFILWWCIASAHAATVLVYGDSLSAGYGIAQVRAWPALLGERLVREKPGWQIANASISGETTAGGRARLPAALERFRPQVLVLALGANDGLRGLSLSQMEDNLAAMIGEARARGVRVLLVGMRLPPNYGPHYTRDFAATFNRLAAREKVPLLPFLLEPIALDEAAFQADRLHPTATAQSKIAEHVWLALRPLLK